MTNDFGPRLRKTDLLTSLMLAYNAADFSDLDSTKSRMRQIGSKLIQDQRVLDQANY